MQMNGNKFYKLEASIMFYQEHKRSMKRKMHIKNCSLIDEILLNSLFTTLQSLLNRNMLFEVVQEKKRNVQI